MGKNVDETAEQRSRRKEKEKIKNVKTNTSTKKQKEDETPEERERRKQKKEQRKKEEQSQALKEKKEANQQQQQRRIATAQQQLNIAQKGKNDDYLAGMDLPSSSEDEDFDEKIERDLTKNAFDGPSDKEAMKARKKEIEMARKEAQMKEDAMKDDDDAFNVRLPAMDEQAMAQMANSRDIKIDNFSVSVRGKPLLTDTNLTIAHGRKYGIVGPNGTGKTTLMKLMARRKIPVPDFIDILLVEQEVVGDEHTALESVVAADVELAELRTKKNGARTINGENGSSR